MTKIKKPLTNAEVVETAKDIVPSSQMESNELIIAFVGAAGVNLTIAEDAVKNRLHKFLYNVEIIKITRHVLPAMQKEASSKFPRDFERIGRMMDFGTEARGSFGTDILAKGAASEIQKRRNSYNPPNLRTAYLIHSLKHPDEVRLLRQMYSTGFYLIGVHAHPDVRRSHLMKIRGMSGEEAEILMQRDRKEKVKHGQQVNDTFHLADFFVGWGGDDDFFSNQKTFDGFGVEDSERIKTKRVQASVDRFIDIIFGHPFRTPAFGEHAMFLAFNASLRSADLSRQVGAVIAREGEILSTGANDCPRSGGGLYWPRYNSSSGVFDDFPSGRDYTRGGDSNRREQESLIKSIIKECKDANLIPMTLAKIHSVINDNREVLNSPEKDKIVKAIIDDLKASDIATVVINKIEALLKSSRIRNITEYGRVVHAEMEALLSCARKGVSTLKATIYCTTFPCHNCAKHIIAAGIQRVVFVEPYLKSKAFEFHKDAIVISYPQDKRKSDNEENSLVKFEPFFGVGPRRFLDLFSMNLGSGGLMVRKDFVTGENVDWDPESAAPRLAMRTVSYLDLESTAAYDFTRVLKKQTNK